MWTQIYNKYKTKIILKWSFQDQFNVNILQEKELIDFKNESITGNILIKKIGNISDIMALCSKLKSLKSSYNSDIRKT